jgi:hypothetical protein
MPPPLSLAEFPEMMESLMVNVPSLKMPPPEEEVEFPEIVELTTVSVP